MSSTNTTSDPTQTMSGNEREGVGFDIYGLFNFVMVSFGLDVLWAKFKVIWYQIVPIVQSMTIMLLMQNKPIIDQMDTMLAPIFGAVWFTI